jgi:hypothetical protein
MNLKKSVALWVLVIVGAVVVGPAEAYYYCPAPTPTWTTVITTGCGNGACYNSPPCRGAAYQTGSKCDYQIGLTECNNYQFSERLYTCDNKGTCYDGGGCLCQDPGATQLRWDCTEGGQTVSQCQETWKGAPKIPSDPDAALPNGADPFN